MKDPKPFQDLLRRGDPARSMTREEAERIRGIVLREAARSEAPAPSPSRWGMVMALASTVVLAIGLGWGLFRVTPEAPTAQENLARPRQIQFETPGGTRIIWVLQPEENLSR
jgi:hypothetical protein